MNHVYYSGYLTYTEIIIRCRFLNKTTFVIIQNIIESCQKTQIIKKSTGNVFYQINKNQYVQNVVNVNINVL